MKILFCTPTFNTTTHGPSRFSNLLYESLKENKEVDFRVLTEDYLGGDKKIFNYRLPRWSAFIKAGKIKSSIIYYFFIKKTLKDFEPDLIVFVDSIYALVPKLIIKNIPILGMINDDDYLSIKSDKKNRVKNYWLKRFHRPLEKVCVKKLDGISCCSKYLKLRIVEEYNVIPNKVFVLYHTIDLNKFVFSERKKNILEPIKVIFIKADYFRGGLLFLIDSVAKMKRRFEITIIGPHKNHEALILNYSSNIENIKIKFLGSCIPDDVKKEIYKNDILCIPSSKEGLGMANIEGLASGIPVISTNVGGIPEVLDNGNNGWLVESANVASLKKAILDCINNPEKRKQKSINGYQYVHRTFNPEKIVCDFRSICQKVIQDFNTNP